jgi:hypothetical protein
MTFCAFIVSRKRSASTEQLGYAVTKGLLTVAATWQISPLNAELNPVCHLLALLVVRHILRVSRLRIKCVP